MLTLEDDVLKTLSDYKVEHRLNSRPVVVTNILREFDAMITSKKHTEYKQIAEYVHEQNMIPDATIGSLAVYCVDQLLLQINNTE